LRGEHLIDFVEHEAVLAEVIGIITATMAGLPARITRDLMLRRRIDAELNDALNRAAARAAQRAKELKLTGETPAL
jgi:hypothetical protein